MSDLPVNCARCSKPAEGYAFINSQRFCHPDNPILPDCYTLESWDITLLQNYALEAAEQYARTIGDGLSHEQRRDLLRKSKEQS